MLHESTALDTLLDRFSSDLVRGFTIRKFCQPRRDGSGPARLLVDDLAAPSVLLALRGSTLCVVGDLPALNPAFADLVADRVESAEPWPWASLREDWARHSGGRRGLFFSASSLASWRAARIAGFEKAPAEYDGDNEFIAFQWSWTGAPRHAADVRHACRRVEPGDTSLFELVRQGIPYDPDGGYIRECLANGPSFVVEAGGLPVSWACTHLGGFMGMLYTPEEHRRHGYARSLWAFQIDAMLAQDDVAACHVIDYNTPSMRLMAGLGGTPLLEPIVWRTLYWPEAEAKDAQAG